MKKSFDLFCLFYPVLTHYCAIKPCGCCGPVDKVLLSHAQGRELESPPWHGGVESNLLSRGTFIIQGRLDGVVIGAKL